MPHGVRQCGEMPDVWVLLLHCSSSLLPLPLWVVTTASALLAPQNMLEDTGRGGIWRGAWGRLPPLGPFDIRTDRAACTALPYH